MFFLSSTTSTGGSGTQQSTTKANVFRCPSGLDQRWTDASKYPVGASYVDDAVRGFIRVGRDRKIDCGYYWNGSSDVTYDTATGQIVAWDFPSMAVPLSTAKDPTQPGTLTALTMADIHANPFLGMHKLEVMTNVGHSSVANAMTGSTPTLAITITGNMTTTIMLADGVGIDAGDSNTAGSLARISAPHIGTDDGGHRLPITNVAYWDGHVEQGNCTRPKVVPGDNSWQTADTAIWTHPNLKGAALGIGHFRLSDGASQ